MTWKQLKAEVRHRLGNQPHLRPVFDHVLDIPYRLHQYHPDLFVVFNYDTGRYEVHSLGQEETTKALDYPYWLLDARLLSLVRKQDVRSHGRTILDRIRQSQARARARLDRQRKNLLEDVIKETKPAFARAAWGVNDPRPYFGPKRGRRT